MKSLIQYFSFSLIITLMLPLNAAKKEDLLGVTPLNLAGIQFLTKKTFVIGNENYIFKGIIKQCNLPNQEFTQLIYALIPSFATPPVGWTLAGGKVIVTLRSNKNGEIFVSTITEPRLVNYSYKHQNIKEINLPTLYSHYTIKNYLEFLLCDEDNPMIEIMRKSLAFMFDMLLMVRDDIKDRTHLICTKCKEPLFNMTTLGTTECDAHTYLGKCKHIVHTACLSDCLTTMSQLERLEQKELAALEKGELPPALEEKEPLIDAKSKDKIDPANIDEHKEAPKEDLIEDLCYLCPECHTVSNMKTIFSIGDFSL